MKPGKARLLPVTADLSLWAYEEALKLAMIDCSEKFPDIQLKVSLFNLDDALKVYVLARNCFVIISPLYAGYEWSVIAGDSEVYSPGAC